MLKNILNKIGLGNNKYPLCGSKIKITWLPYNNGYPDKNAYIGEVGIVDEICQPLCGFWLRLPSGGSLHIGKKFTFEYDD